MEAIPIVVRKQILKLYDQGRRTGQIALALGYCAAAVRRVRQHFRQRGTLEPQTHLCGRKGHFTPERQERLRQLLLAKPDATLAELCRQMDIDVAVSTMDVWTRQLGFTFKKSPSTPPSRAGRTWRRSAPAGTKTSPRSRRKSSSSSMNPASRPT